MSQYKRIVNKLLLHIKSGDKEKINDLFKLTFDHIKIIAITNLFNKNDYEDVVEESFLRIIKYIGSFNHQTGITGYARLWKMLLKILIVKIKIFKAIAKFCPM